VTNLDLAIFATELVETLKRFGKKRHHPINAPGDVIEVSQAEFDQLVEASEKTRDSARGEAAEA
jgi:hypothetical protein